MTVIRLGTRGSKLALIQTGMVEAAIKRANPAVTVETVIITTSGDWKPQDGEKALSQAAGGKGQFIKEIEVALQDGRIDCGVHSLKDVPTDLEDGFVLSHVLEREDPRDAFIARGGVAALSDLPRGARLGTSSKRRQFMALHVRPDLKPEVLRGNVDTRLGKLADGQVDATFLAVAGLKRMGLADKITRILEVDEMLPAVGQGAIGLEIRAGDAATRAALDPLDHAPTHLAVLAERAMLRVLGASCHTPVGSFAEWTGAGKLRLRGMIGTEDGAFVARADLSADVDGFDAAEDLGHRAGHELISATPADIMRVIGLNV